MTKDARSGLTGLLMRLPLSRDKPWVGYVVAVLACLLALWLRLSLMGVLSTTLPFITFLAAVILTSFFYGLGPGIVSAVLSLLLTNYFFLEPVNSLKLTGASALALGFIAMVVLIQIGLTHLMQKANAALDAERRRSEELAENRELLFKELQHRVGNNLQMVGSLIALQKRRVHEQAAKDALDEASRRLGLVGRIQRQLYDPAGAQLSLAAYIDQICRDVIAASGRDSITYEFHAQVDATLPPDKAIPTALVVAEAVNNAIEHGFAGDGTGKVAAMVGRNAGKVEVVIADNGAGLPPGFDIMQSESLGLKIARTLAQSLGGSFTLTAAPLGRGTVARLVIGPEIAEPPLPA